MPGTQRGSQWARTQQTTRPTGTRPAAGTSFLDAITGGPPNYGPTVMRNGRPVPVNIASPNTVRMPNSGATTIGMNIPWGATNPNATGQPPAGQPITFPRSAAPEDVDAYVRQHYGYFAGFLDNPEIGGILRQAALQGWDESKLYGAVTATNWWKNTSAAQRTWQQLTSEDPAEARRLVGQTAATIQNRARALGLPMSGGTIASLAHTATANGWTDAQTVDHLMNQINWSTLEAGDLTALRDDVKTVAGDYLVDVSDETAQNYAARIASGEMTQEGVRSAMLQQAKARFGWMADQLDQGVTVKDYLAPVANTIANELEVAPEEINLMSGEWLSMVETRGEDGKLRAATLDEARLAARKKPQWTNTQKAKETTTNMASMISEVFGRR